MPNPSPLDELRFFLFFLVAESDTELLLLVVANADIDEDEGVTNAQHVDNGSRDRKRTVGGDFIVAIVTVGWMNGGR